MLTAKLIFLFILSNKKFIRNHFLTFRSFAHAKNLEPVQSYYQTSTHYNNRGAPLKARLYYYNV